MNYLAHAYLSFNNSAILAGNISSDFIKGKKQYEYKGLVHKGIQLHRAIDAFTDAHPATAAIKNFFKQDYRLYSGAFVDVVYDYFLANDTGEFATQENLQTFVQETYQSLHEQYEQLPPDFQPVFEHMRTHNWLYNYRYTWGIQKSFAGIAYRAKFIEDSDTAFRIFESNIEAIRPYYSDFFPLLKKYTADTLQQLVHDE